jgi:hypothetical protein
MYVLYLMFICQLFYCKVKALGSCGHMRVVLAIPTACSAVLVLVAFVKWFTCICTCVFVHSGTIFENMLLENTNLGRHCETIGTCQSAYQG